MKWFLMSIGDMLKMELHLEYFSLLYVFGFDRQACVCGFGAVGSDRRTHSVGRISDGPVHLSAADSQSPEFPPQRSSCKGHRKGH